MACYVERIMNMSGLNVYKIVKCVLLGQLLHNYRKYSQTARGSAKVKRILNVETIIADIQILIVVFAIGDRLK